MSDTAPRDPRPRKVDAMEFASNAYYAILNRPLTIFDPQIFNDPALNPRYTAPGERTIGDETPEEWARLIYSEQSTERLYEILDGHYLLVIDGQVIHKILIERGAWDASRIGTTSTFVPWTPVLPAWMPNRLVHSTHYAAEQAAARDATRVHHSHPSHHSHPRSAA